ncbi:hypothetical protein Agabi119p4_7780 [Agaricus bisporus var. burnettii]|uniref:Uncharacterized protein n=1 Tax=Agaricus bisporus var. burnettii TaxID=192524 RepID=A0A8H7C7R5_AGABI|nr:hypothetical protein Agabi119p4_7780 [Agaricus bisporus var. burnettii]
MKSSSTPPDRQVAGTREGATPQKKTAPLPEAPLLTALEPLLSPLSFPELILGEKIGGGSAWGRKKGRWRDGTGRKRRNLTAQLFDGPFNKGDGTINSRQICRRSLTRAQPSHYEPPRRAGPSRSDRE